MRADGLAVTACVACACVLWPADAGDPDIQLDEKAKNTHRIDSLNILLYTFLLILTVVTIWMFKHRRLRFLHETGLAVIYGLFVGAIIRYTVTRETITHLQVVKQPGLPSYNITAPPDRLWMSMSKVDKDMKRTNKTYQYHFRGEVTSGDSNEIEQKATFDPEIFFNILLPPIIFNAGYSLKRKYFFRNLGSIMTLAFVGTTISCFVIGGVLHLFTKLVPYLSNTFTFLDTLYFGALISATDPVTVLAIFNDLHVDVNLYAMVFGESVLNDAVAMVLSGAIQNYGEKYQLNKTGDFETVAFFKAMGEFVFIFGLSLLIGAGMGSFTALLTKFTRVRDFPLLEAALFVLMSYSTFLIAEVADLTGIVAVLFCGICQAHYTYNNLSSDSRTRTKQLFELLNFLAENFIFSYIGVSMFTFPKHRFDGGFICAAFVAIAIGRAANIYPLIALLNLGRKHKIPFNFQHMLFFSGLRGAVAFALAIRNTVSEARQILLTTTSMIAIVSVVVCGGSTMQLLTWFRIPVGMEEEAESLQYSGVHSGPEMRPLEGSTVNTGSDKAWLARVWHDFDVHYMKPFLTHSRPTLLETLPVSCTPLARLLTTTEQLTQESPSKGYNLSDSDLCLDDNEALDGQRHTTIREDPETHSQHSVEAHNFM